MPNANAQCPSESGFGAQWVQGAFGIAGTEVGTQCTGRAVVVSTPTAVARARYIYDYKNRADTAKATTATTYTYTTPGPYYIVQLGTVNGRPAMSCNLVQVYATAKPDFTIKGNCQNLVTLTVNTAGQIYGQYNIDWGDGSSPQVYLPSQPPLTYTYTNNDTYQIKVKGEGTLAFQGCNATSDAQTFKTADNPAPINAAVVSVQNDKVNKVSISLPDSSVRVKQFVFIKNGTEIKQDSNMFIDSTTIQTCYQVSYIDACDRRPATTPTLCSIYAEAEGEIVRWSSQSPFVSAIQNYTVEKINQNGQVISTYAVGTSTNWQIDPNDPDQTVICRIRATSLDGQTSLSNTVRFSRFIAFFVPDIFTPNDDGINDIFELKGQFIDKGEVSIFDRWGNVLFHTDDWKKSWDGTDTNGRKMNNGHYTYQIKYSDTKKNFYIKSGAIFLMR